MPRVVLNLFCWLLDGLTLLSSEESDGDFSPPIPRGLQSVHRPWKLILLDLSPARKTRPPKEVRHLWDPRIWRPSSPRWKVTSLLSPPPPERWN